LQPVLGIARDDRFAIGLTAIDDYTLGSAMARKRHAQEAFGRRQISSKNSTVSPTLSTAR
jgi:hypothetical protein